MHIALKILKIVVRGKDRKWKRIPKRRGAREETVLKK